MKLRVVSGITLTLFLASMLSLVFNATMARAEENPVVSAFHDRVKIYHASIFEDSVTNVELDGIHMRYFYLRPQAGADVHNATIVMETPYAEEDFSSMSWNPPANYTVTPLDGNLSFEWAYHDSIPPLGEAVVWFSSKLPLTFKPEFDFQRIIDPILLASPSVNQTLTIEFTPHIDFFNTHIQVSVQNTSEALPTVIPRSASPDWMRFETINEVDWQFDPNMTTYTFSVQINVQNKLYPTPIYYKPSVGIGAFFNYSISTVHSTEGVTVEDNLTNGSVTYSGTNSTGGIYDWQVITQYENSVAFPSYSSAYLDSTKPVADAGIYQPVVEDTIVNFDASASYDPDGEIVSYEWDFGDGTIGTGLTVNHTYTEPGAYNVTLTVRDAAGNESTQSTTIIVRHAEPIREPRSVYIVAEVAVVGAAATAATAALASFGGLGQSLNSAVSRLPIPDKLKDFLQLYGEKIFETVDKAKLEALEKVPFITKGDLVALGISALLMAIVFGYVEANGLPRFLNLSVLAAVIPSTLLSACLVSIAGELSEALSARTCRVYRQYRLWMYGLGVFLISGLLFLFPFSSPGITRYQSGEISNKTKGLVVLSKMLILLTLTIPFAGLFMLGFKTVSDAGLLLTLMTVCYSLVPLKPLAGKAVFDYRKEVSLIAFILTGILFYGCTVNLLPHVTYLAIGAVSGILATITLSQLRKAHTK